MTPHEFLDAVRDYISAVGGRIESYGRDPENNIAVGGVAHSPHVVWLGADVKYVTPFPLEERKNWAERLGLKLLPNPEKGYDHLQPLTWQAG